MITSNFFRCLYIAKLKDESEQPLVLASCFSSCFSSIFSQSQYKEIEYIKIYAVEENTPLGKAGPNTTLKFNDNELKLLQGYFRKSDYNFDFKRVDLDIKLLKDRLTLQVKEPVSYLKDVEPFMEFTVRQDDFKSFDSFMLCCHFIRYCYEGFLFTFVQKAMEEKKKLPKVSIITLLIWATVIVDEPELYHQDKSHSHRTFQKQGVAAYPYSYLQVKKLEKSRHGMINSSSKKLRSNNFISVICSEIRNEYASTVKGKTDQFKRDNVIGYIEYISQFDKDPDLKKIIEKYKKTK